MFLQYIGQNAHFAISLLAAMVFFAVFWLYADAWSNKKGWKESLKWIGALLLSVSFLIEATTIEQSDFGRSILGNGSQTLSVIFRLAGYIVLIVGQLIDPLQKKPNSPGLTEKDLAGGTLPAATLATGSKVLGLVFALPVGSLVIGVLYFRRATAGLERHLRLVAYGFFLLSLSELAGLGRLLRNTDNPNLYNLAKPFGCFWIIEHLLLLASSLVIGFWVWRYLVERFFSQLFMIFVSSAVFIFLTTAVGFTFLLMSNVRNSALDNLQTASNVLNYALDAKKSSAQSDVDLIAQNPGVISAIEAKDHAALLMATDNFLRDKKDSGLVITNADAEVLLRAQQPDRWGDSISSDTAVRRAAIGESSSTISSITGVLAPTALINSFTPIKDGSTIVGTAGASIALDNAFLDGIKNSTGLDSTIFIGAVRSATTLTSSSDPTRQVGTKITDQKVINTVLKQGRVYRGDATIFNSPYLAIYSPLRDANNNVIGMFFLGEPRSSLVTDAGRSTQLTFLVAAALTILSIAPAFLVARHISEQLE